MELFAQCLLVKYLPNKRGMLKTVSWLPIEFAESMRLLKLQNDDGTWSDGWMVQEIYGTHTKEFVLEHERDFARQRKASDI
jgi:squalene cyclase